MSYIRPMGDGPITHPSEVEDPPIVPPTRVSCDELPADSPWKRPGQVCAPPPDGQPWFDAIKDLFFPDSNQTPTVPSETPQSSGSTPWLLLVAGGGLAYYLLRKK